MSATPFGSTSPSPTAGPAADLPVDPLDVVVIGAGQAGLAVSYFLARAGLRFLALDAHPRLGHVWRSRWDSLRLFTAAEYSGLPGMPFPAAAGSYPTKDEVADYLAAYAARFCLPVALSARVIRLSRSGELFLVHTDRGLVTARQVVVATGAFQRPVVPGVAAALGSDVVQLHSSSYRRPGDLPEGRVLVVGAGNSGLQIALELAATRSVSVARGSRQPMVPQRPLGRDLFWWMTKAGLIARPVTSPVTKLLRRRGGDLVIGTTGAMLRDAGIDCRPRLVAAEGRVVSFADGTTAEVDGVLWATGFRPDYDWIDIPGVWDGRQVAHDRGITEVPGLAFVGLPWQHTRGSALLGFVEEDAAWVADRVTAAAKGGSAAGRPQAVGSSSS
jgi:putative flavoprotein involved in K+ transport